QSNVTKARVQAGTSKRQLDRTKYLASRQLIAQADLETAQANYDTAQAQVIAERASLQQAAASLHQAEVNLGYATIVSPVDGVVISRNIDVGQTVAASLQAPTLFLIAQDLRQVQVDTNVAEADIGKLKAGLQAEFTVDAFPGETFKGRVRQIRNAPQTVQNVVTYDAVLDVENPEQKLKPGMTANVSFLYDSRKDVLRVPNAALRFQMPRPEGRANRPQGTGDRPRASGEGAPGMGDRSQGGSEGKMRRVRWQLAEGQKRIWVLQDGRPRPVVITPGLTDGSFTEVVDGKLEEGDQVVTSASGVVAGNRSRQQRGGQGNGRAMRMF
ncbi:MAG TPA: efflux RND transporter periplasmic adaptor subunit, partial [Stenomitos sp.]